MKILINHLLPAVGCTYCTYPYIYLNFAQNHFCEYDIEFNFYSKYNAIPVYRYCILFFSTGHSSTFGPQFFLFVISLFYKKNELCSSMI